MNKIKIIASVSVGYCYLEQLHWISAVCHYLSEDITKKLCVCSFKMRLLQVTFGRLFSVASF